MAKIKITKVRAHTRKVTPRAPKTEPAPAATVEAASPAPRPPMGAPAAPAARATTLAQVQARRHAGG